MVDDMPDLQEQFGQIDIYLFDQLLRGRIAPGMRVMDAGCGSGRNLVYFLREGYEVFGADSNPQAIQSVQRLAAQLAPALPSTNFHAESIERTTFPPAFADVVISSAVLHFAHDDQQFQAMLRGTWNALKSRWAVLLPPCIFDRHGAAGPAGARQAVPPAGWV